MTEDSPTTDPLTELLGKSQEPIIPESPEVQKFKSYDELALERIKASFKDPLDAAPWTKCIFYGDVGSGKTAAACAAPDPNLIAIEVGQLTLVNHPDIIMNGVNVMEFKSVKQVEDYVRFHKEGKFPDHKTIVLDTYSELQYVALDKRVQERYAEDRNRDPYTPEGKDYQGNTGHMRRIAAAFRDIEANVIFVCHEKDVEKATGATIRRPSLTEQVSKSLNQYVDVIAYQWNEVDAEGEEHFWAAVRPIRMPGVTITAKTRIKSLPTRIENLTFDMINEAKIKQIEEIRKLRNAG